jgi:hypothetical protein
MSKIRDWKSKDDKQIMITALEQVQKYWPILEDMKKTRKIGGPDIMQEILTKEKFTKVSSIAIMNYALRIFL